MFGDSITAIKGSITNLPLLKDAFQGAEGIFHLGAIASVARSVSDPAATHETNLSGTLNVILAARDCGVRKVVFASSSAIYGSSLHSRSVKICLQSPSHRMQFPNWRYYLAVFKYFDVKTVSLRYFNVFGPRQDPNSEYAAVIPKFITRFLDTKPPIIFGDGLQSRDFVYVKDVVRADLLAMQSASVTGTFNIGNGKSINLNTLANTIGEIMHVRIPPIYQIRGYPQFRF